MAPAGKPLVAKDSRPERLHNEQKVNEGKSGKQRGRSKAIGGEPSRA